MNNKNKEVEIKDKVLLTISEASQLFNIGENKLRTMITLDKEVDWLFTVGKRNLIKRSKFEDFVLNTPGI
jgi:hypothetical protein